MLTAPETTQPGKKESCHHFWKIESPNGEASVGKCKYCGMVKQFLNHAPKPGMNYVISTKSLKGKDLEGAFDFEGDSPLVLASAESR